MQPDTHLQPAKPGDTPGQVEPDDSRPQPINAADPLDEAIEAAVERLRPGLPTGYDPRPLAGLAVRAAAPIIAAPIEAERLKSVNLLTAVIADLRARLATAERDALLRAADAVNGEDEWLYHVARSDVADWLRERAKALPLSTEEEGRRADGS